MQALQEEQYLLKPADYKNSIKNNQRFYLQFNFFSPEVEAVFMKIIHRFLENHDILYLKEMLLTVIREIITNAVKANTKRLYFKLKKLDISKKEEYRQGMESFKNDVYGSDNTIFEKLKEVNLLVRIIFEYIHDSIQITIINNTPILEEEQKKIESRINKAYTYNDISEAFEDVMDDSEGAGLGLIMAIMLMKNAGFSKESFKLKCEKGLTTTTIKAPLGIDREEHNIKIAEELTKELEKIPSFPENIIEIQKLCSDPESTVKQISESIKRDPGLTTSLLKLANSAGYITLKHTKTIEDAVKLIGLKTINALLIATGVQQIMTSRYQKFENVWKDSYRAAHYANKMAIQIKKTKLNEFAYLAALLGDIGQIVLLSIKPELTQKIHDIAGTKIIENASLLEEMSLGVSHSTLGSLICEKWKFNESLTEVIKYHHRPHLAPEKYKDLTYLVYIAYSFVDIENRRMRFELLDEDVLNYYNLNDKEKLELLHRALKETYEKQYGGII
ncbi:MAG: HDOD domain-containing protein [Spirochaetes bacterium]|nr:HDOD domain-containing protein [Spirochaetota bacterium]